MSDKKYDLEDRTQQFAIAVRMYCKRINKSVINIDDIRQLVRASGSVGANYIEANDGLSPKDFLYRIRVCKKEAKEARFWLRVMIMGQQELTATRNALINETEELMRIFATIIRKFN